MPKSNNIGFCFRALRATFGALWLGLVAPGSLALAATDSTSAPDPMGPGPVPELGAGGVISGLILLIGAGMLIADWRRRK